MSKTKRRDRTHEKNDFTNLGPNPWRMYRRKNSVTKSKQSGGAVKGAMAMKELVLCSGCVLFSSGLGLSLQALWYENLLMMVGLYWMMIGTLDKKQ